MVILKLLILHVLSYAQAQTTCGLTSDLKAQALKIQEACETASYGKQICDDSFTVLKGQSPEKALKAQLNLSDEEAAVCLIMAETAASGCQSPAVAQGIADVLKNRIASKKFGASLEEVVLQEGQFRSSTGGCDVARRDLFLCPSKEAELYKMAQTAFKNSEKSLPGNTFNYFFFKHFDQSTNCGKWKGVTPKWAIQKNRVQPTGLKVDDQCIGFYKL